MQGADRGHDRGHDRGRHQGMMSRATSERARCDTDGRCLIEGCGGTPRPWGVPVSNHMYALHLFGCDGDSHRAFAAMQAEAML